jgi:hypothetical protein
MCEENIQRKIIHVDMDSMPRLNKWTIQNSKGNH